MEWVDIERDLLVRRSPPESLDGGGEGALGDDDLDAVLGHALLRPHLADGRIGALSREERAGAGGVPRAALVVADHAPAGGARGNPGPAAYAYVLEAEDGTVLAAHGEAIGVATNNVAEYSALGAGLEKAAEIGVTELEVISDSELMVKQMRGEYRVKNEALRDLFLRATQLARQVGSVSYKAVRREHNKLADQLVNEALDSEAAG